jgi:hypothetical protein
MNLLCQHRQEPHSTLIHTWVIVQGISYLDEGVVPLLTMTHPECSQSGVSRITAYIVHTTSYIACRNV